MKRPRFDAVLIDFFGTIADGDGRQVAATCARIVQDYKLSIKAEELAPLWGRQFFAVLDESNDGQFRNLYDCECVSLCRTMSTLGKDCDPRPYADELRRYWENPPLHGDAKEALSRLSVPVCCVSNADEADLRSAIVRHGLRFAGVLSSERARCYKPDPRIFEQALAELRVRPDRCLHVGDSLHSDISGAQRLGITGAWIRRDGRISDIGQADPDVVIHSLLELPRCVENG